MSCEIRRSSNPYIFRFFDVNGWYPKASCSDITDISTKNFIGVFATKTHRYQLPLSGGFVPKADIRHLILSLFCISILPRKRTVRIFYTSWWPKSFKNSRLAWNSFTSTSITWGLNRVKSARRGHTSFDFKPISFLNFVSIAGIDYLI